MKIEIDKKDYEILLKHIYIWNWVYGLMSDAVNSKYKKEADMWDELLHKVLKHTENKNIKTKFEWKNCFTDEFWDTIDPDITDYEHYVVDDLTGIDMEEVEREIENEINNPLFIK